MFSSADPFLHPSISASSPLISAFLRLWRRGLIPVSSAFTGIYSQRAVCCCQIVDDASLIKPLWLCLCALLLGSVLSRSAWLCVQLFCPSGSTGRERSEVNQSKLPICTLSGLRSVYSCVCWQACECIRLNKNIRPWSRLRHTHALFPKSPTWSSFTEAG